MGQNQNSGIKNVFSRFRRGSASKTPGGKVGSATKIETGGPSPSKRLFAFSPAKASVHSHDITLSQATTADLIPAAHATGAASTAVGASHATEDSSTIKVVVRVRPRNDREASMGGAICVQPQNANSVRLVPPAEPHAFSFDYVAGEKTSQQDMFDVAGRPIVENCLKGFNGCLFAYGQTGSGKTYSMLGGEQTGVAALAGDEQRGLIQRIFEHIFAAAEAQVNTIINCDYTQHYILCKLKLNQAS